MAKEYLGDNVYVEWVKNTLELTTDALGVENVIYLEPVVMKSLIKYYKKMSGIIDK